LPFLAAKITVIFMYSEPPSPACVGETFRLKVSGSIQKQDDLWR